MIRFSKIISLLVLVFSCCQAHAQWTAPVKVKTVVVVGSGGVNVKVDPPLSGCQSQAGYGSNYASIYPNHPGLKSMHANLLLALATGATVQLWFSDSKCTIGEMTVGEPW